MAATLVSGGGTDSTVLIELVENLVSLAAAAELSASTAAEAAAANNSTTSSSAADQTFTVISGEFISLLQTQTLYKFNLLKLTESETPLWSYCDNSIG